MPTVLSFSMPLFSYFLCVTISLSLVRVSLFFSCSRFYSRFNFSLLTGFRKDGFCISFENEPLLQSHILCVYADVFFAALILLLYFFNRSLSGANFLKQSALGMLGHGLGHFFTWKYPREDKVPMLHSVQWLQYSSQEKALFLSAALLFWFGFFQAIKASIWHKIFHAVLNTFIGLFYVPTNLGFTYVLSLVHFAAP